MLYAISTKMLSRPCGQDLNWASEADPNLKILASLSLSSDQFTIVRLFYFTGFAERVQSLVLDVQLRAQFCARTISMDLGHSPETGNDASIT